MSWLIACSCPAHNLLTPKERPPVNTIYDSKSLLYGDITGALFNAFIELNYYFSSRQSFSEHEMCRALAVEMQARGYSCQLEVPVEHTYSGESIGTGYIDLVIDDRVAVEVKKTHQLSPAALDQLRLYMEHSGLRVGIAMTFGRPYAKLSQESVRRQLFRRVELE